MTRAHATACAIALSVACALATALVTSAVAAPSTAAASAASRAAGEPSSAPAKLDRSGRKRVGKASFYAKRFEGKKMASGRRMNPRAKNAASKTLPLGTVARVTNVETGDSTVVNFEDRGPYVKGRIVDLSPAAAEAIGIDKKKGVGTVEVAPVAIPQADGTIKPGAAASELNKQDEPGRAAAAKGQR